MAIRARIKIDAKCKAHPRFNPSKDIAHPGCEGCDRIYVMYLYTNILARATRSDKVAFRGTVEVEDARANAEEPKLEEKETHANDIRESEGTNEATAKPEKSSDAA